MPTYLHPGVYVEEIPSGVRPIEGVATSVAAFVGPARRGPTGQAERISSFDDYERTYGSIVDKDDVMGLAVSKFYQNGGKAAYIGRVAGTAPPAAAASFNVEGEDSGVAMVIKISATSVGKWGNDVRFRIVKENAADLDFTLEVGHLEDDGFHGDEEFPGVNMIATSDDYLLKRVNGESALVEIALLPAADPDDDANQYQKGSLTGAAVAADPALFDTDVKDSMTMTLNIDSLGAKKITLGTALSLLLTGLDNAGDGTKLADAITDAVVALGPTQDSYKDFTCAYDGVDRKFVLTSGAKSSASSVVVYGGTAQPTDLAVLIKVDSASNPISVHGSAKVVPKAMMGDSNTGVPLAGGDESAPAASDYKTFFGTTLIKVRDVTIIVMPGQSIADDGSGNAAIDEAIAHCEKTRSRMVIVDPPEDFELDQGTKVEQLALSTSTYAALYYPWVKIANPFYNADTNPTAPLTLTIAPSAFAAGMWSKTDGRRGVWKAPAGVETALLGVSDLEYDVGDDEQDVLNPLGVNCLRRLSVAGLAARVIWGSRTLSTKADPEWRYVPVRRTAIFLEQSIYNSIQWAVFEPNDHRLWASLRLNIDSFMNGLFRAGAFQGEKSSQAYFVRCGLGDTMTQGDIDRGQVIVIIGFAPLKPAEFVIVRIQQMVGKQ